MFKGLRTKIESEQKGQSPSRSNKLAPTGTTTQENNPSNQKGSAGNNSSTPNNNDPSQVFNKPNEPAPTNSNIQSLEDKRLDSLAGNVAAEFTNKYQEPTNEDSLQTVAGDLKGEVARLNDQLKNVMKERDECNDQNAQLYQLIEKLRRNLETEKETNTSLQNRLNQVESALKEREESDSQRGINTSSKNISIRSVETNDASKVEAESYENLIVRLNELQSQLSDKTRQLKIRQQNMNDIKKALQREVIDHGKTQEELCRLQSQLKQLHGRNDTNGNEIQQHNGSTTSDIDAATRTNLNLYSDKNHETKDVCDELTGGGHQLELMSNLSSAASVDDFDSNDNQHHHNNKEVNHEYLRNVLFRYMTSTDTETAQHLVKAISVLMNFTPEQSSAIKSAMNSRSSWLRLKK